MRERRILREMRQTDLAKAVGISPAYLNLIEHNRRRIGGKLLLDIAEVLGVEAAVLSEGAEAALLSSLQQASADHPSIDVENARLEEFAGRFPGWAELLAAQNAEIANLRHGVEALNDRLSHDPFLSTALHEVLSTVSSIQSSASILVDSADLEKEWRDRFQRNIFEDSHRLAETSKSLVGYLDPDQESDATPASPIEDLDQFLSARGYDLSRLAPEASVPETQSEPARQITHAFLEEMRNIITQIPDDKLTEVEAQTSDPAEMATLCNVPLPLIFKRLAFRAPEEGQTVYGYLSVDASGAYLAKRQIEGFTLPRFGGGCPLWPLFVAFSQPNTPLHSYIKQTGRDSEPMEVFALAAPESAPSFRQANRFVSHMLFRVSPSDETPHEVGVNCRICAAKGCDARRELSILADGF